MGSCIPINYLLNLVSNSREIRYVTSMRITPATTSYITCCFVVNVDMNTAIAQIQKVVRIHCGTFIATNANIAQPAYKAVYRWKRLSAASILYRKRMSCAHMSEPTISGRVLVVGYTT